MAEKRPLALYAGVVEELRSGDTVPTPSGLVREKSFNAPGDLTTFIGTIRWYPMVDIILAHVRATVSTAPVGADILIDIKKNGVSILGSALTITAGSNASSAVVPSTTSILSTDYLTVDVTQIGSTTPGSDLVVQFEF